MERKGMIHLYVGDGKGKTTAAAGLALRALGSGSRVIFAQFLKGRPSGEVAPLEKLGAKIIRPKVGGKFISSMTPEELEAEKEANLIALAQIREGMEAGCDLVVLDEAVDAVGCCILPLGALLDALCARPPHVEVVLTGRNPPGELASMADYYTQFACKRHPYDKGVAARKGIEY